MIAVEITDGALHVAAADAAPAPIQASSATVHVRHVIRVDDGTKSQSVGGFEVGRVNFPADESASHENVTMAAIGIEPRPGFEMFVRVVDGEGQLRADFGHAEIPALGHLYRSYTFRKGPEDSAYGFDATLPDASVAFVRNDENRADTFSRAAPTTNLTATGSVTLLVVNARVTVDGAEGRYTYDTSETTSTRAAGANAEEQRRLEFVVLEATGLSLQASTDTQRIRLFAPEPTVTTDGRVELRQARGTIATNGGSRTLAGDNVTLAGTMALALRLTHGPEIDTNAPLVPISMRSDGVASSSDLNGEFRVLMLNGQSVAAPAAPGLTTPEKAAVGVGLGALLLGALVAAKKLLLPALGLFARPEPLHPMLENSLRMRLHGLVNAYPGVHGRRLQSLAQVATGTFEHHMRLLLHANLVREERIGGRVVYVPCDPDAPRPKVDRDELAIRVLLMTEARRRVAESIAQGPKTQRELVDVLQLPQQTVSFHVKALLDHKVIVASDGRPASYWVNPAYVDLISGASSLGEQQGILGRVLQRVRGSSPAEAPAAS